MTRLFVFLGATIGGYAGWALGALVGMGTAMFAGVVGTAIGVYVGRRMSEYF